MNKWMNCVFCSNPWLWHTDSGGLSYVLIQAPPKDCVTTTVGFEILGGPLLQDQTLHFSQKILTVPIATNIQVSVFESD